MGTFVTAPKTNDDASIKFAWTGDYDAEPAVGQTQPFWNDFGVFRSMQAEGNDFNVALGDTIYSDSEVPGKLNPVALTVAQKWAKYRLNLGQAPLADLRGTAGFYSHWDDHEFINDFSRFENVFSSGTIDGQQLYDNGVKAFTDFAPVDYSSGDGLYRTRQWGKNLELFFLDERSFRSAKASNGRRLRQPADRSAGPRADRPPSRPKRLRAPDPLAGPARVTGLPGHDQRSEPDDARGPAGEAVPARRTALIGSLQGGDERGPDPAVLRESLRSLGGL